MTMKKKKKKKIDIFLPFNFVIILDNYNYLGFSSENIIQINLDWIESSSGIGFSGYISFSFSFPFPTACTTVKLL